MFHVVNLLDHGYDSVVLGNGWVLCATTFVLSNEVNDPDQIIQKMTTVTCMSWRNFTLTRAQMRTQLWAYSSQCICSGQRLHFLN